MSPQFLSERMNVLIERLESRRLLSAGAVEVVPEGVELTGRYNGSDVARVRIHVEAKRSYVFIKHQNSMQLRILSKDGSHRLAEAEQFIYDGEPDGFYHDRLDWVAPQSGDYLVEFFMPGAAQNPYSEYRLAARESVDDTGNGPGQATAVADHETVHGRIDSANDRDWFSFKAEAGKNYRVLRDDLGFGGQEVAIYGSDGKTLIGKTGIGEDYWSFTFTPRQSGTYYASVSMLPEFDGDEYTLTVDSLSDAGTSLKNAPAWDLKGPITADLSAEGEVDYFRFEAQAGEKLVFDSLGMKDFAIVDSDGSEQHLVIYDGAYSEWTPGRLEWEAPHTGTFYVSVSAYTGFLSYSPTGPYWLWAYDVDESARPEDGPLIQAGQIGGKFQSAGEADYYSFEAKAGTVYRFELASGGPVDYGFTFHYLMEVVEARPSMLASYMPTNAQEKYPGHNFYLLNMDGQKALRAVAEWIAPASGTYHFSIAPLDAEHVGPYTLKMTAFQDDLVNDEAHPALLAIGKKRVGHIDFDYDNDYFAIDAEAGKTYTVTVSPQSPVAKGTYWYVRIAMGDVLGQPDDPMGEGKPQMITFRAEESRRYVFKVGEFFSSTAYVITAVEANGFPCDPQAEAIATSRNTPAKPSSHSVRHQKPRKHHRRPVVHKHATTSAKENLHSARQKLLSLARD